MKSKLLILLLAVSCLAAAPAPLQAPANYIDRDATAAQFEQNAVLAQLYVNLFVGYPEAQQYFTGRRDAFRDAASFVRQQAGVTTTTAVQTLIQQPHGRAYR